MQDLPKQIIRKAQKSPPRLFSVGYLKIPFKYSFRAAMACDKTDLKINRIVGPRSCHSWSPQVVGPSRI